MLKRELKGILEARKWFFTGKSVPWRPGPQTLFPRISRSLEISWTFRVKRLEIRRGGGEKVIKPVSKLGYKEIFYRKLTMLKSRRRK